MNKKLVLPFQNMSPKAWQNLALAAMLVFYLTFIGFFILRGQICKTYIIDYCAYYSTGKIINERDFASIYNLDILYQYQKEIYFSNNTITDTFRPVEVPYLPLFVIPFKFFSLIKLTPSYFSWILFNLVGFIFYLYFFTKKLTGTPIPFRLGLMSMLSLPVFVNVYEGQVNFWLGICVGEFIRAYLNNKPYKAGIWLGGLLLKPQLLILVIPFLVIKHSLKSLTGFAISIFSVFVVSFVLIKTDGFLYLTNILLESAEGRATSNVSAMMNWRMLGFYISSFTSKNIGTTIMVLGSLLTACITLIVLKNSDMANPPMMGVSLLGIFAATGAVTWHAHLHMAVILIPPMIYLLMKGHFNKQLFLAWLFIPIPIQILSYVYLVFVNLEIIPRIIYPVEKLIPGLTGLILNLTILSWTIVEVNRKKKETHKAITHSNNSQLIK